MQQLFFSLKIPAKYYSRFSRNLTLQVEGGNSAWSGGSYVLLLAIRDLCTAVLSKNAL